MRTNIEIDDALMEQAQKASGNRNKKQTVEQALRLDGEAARAAGGRRLRSASTAGAAISPGSQRTRGRVIVVDSSIWIDFLNGCAACPADSDALLWHGRDRRGDLMLCKVLQGLDSVRAAPTLRRDAARKRQFPRYFNAICPVQSLPQKQFPSRSPQLSTRIRRLIPHEGRIAIVTDAGWDVVDAAASGA